MKDPCLNHLPHHHHLYFPPNGEDPRKEPSPPLLPSRRKFVVQMSLFLYHLLSGGHPFNSQHPSHLSMPWSPRFECYYRCCLSVFQLPPQSSFEIHPPLFITILYPRICIAKIGEPFESPLLGQSLQCIVVRVTNRKAEKPQLRLRLNEKRLPPNEVR